MDWWRLHWQSSSPPSRPNHNRLPVCRSPGRLSPPQRPVQRSAQTGQYEHHGETSTAASSVFVHRLVIVIMAVVGEMAVTHSQCVAFIVNMLKENIPFLILIPVERYFSSRITNEAEPFSIDALACVKILSKLSFLFLLQQRVSLVKELRH